MRTLRQALDAANPNSLGNAAQALPLGRAMSIVPVSARLTVAAQAAALPDNAKALQVVRCYGTAGSIGNKVIAVAEATPGAGEVAVTQTGNLAFGDAGLTACEVTYLAYEGDVVEETLPISGSAAAIPSGGFACVLISATITSGLIPGAKIVDDRNTAPATLHAALNAAGTSVLFNASDAVSGFALVKYVRRPTTSLAASLDVTVNF